MKKLKLFLTVLVLSISSVTMAQTYHLKATSLHYSDGVNKRNVGVDINIKLDTTTKRLTIYSDETQIIDYEDYRSYVDRDDYTVIECTATDSHYKRIGLEVMFDNNSNHVVIVIEYSDAAYSYSCWFIR